MRETTSDQQLKFLYSASWMAAQLAGSQWLLTPVALQACHHLRLLSPSTPHQLRHHRCYPLA
jgi:hypothetical protein